MVLPLLEKFPSLLDVIIHLFDHCFFRLEPDYSSKLFACVDFDVLAVEVAVSKIQYVGLRSDLVIAESHRGANIDDRRKRLILKHGVPSVEALRDGCLDLNVGRRKTEPSAITGVWSDFAGDFQNLVSVFTAGMLNIFN